MSTVSSADLAISRRGKLMIVELNRPKALNSLNLDMCHELKAFMSNVNSASSGIATFLVKGSGGKAFCAGGDIKTLYQTLVKDEAFALQPGKIYTDFFRHEYILDHLMGTSSVPQISFWNGIVMGGGVGISVLGEFRVATEKSMFAMPECAIGLFPDVGSSSWLPHLTDGFGKYIGQSGLCHW